MPALPEPEARELDLRAGTAWAMTDGSRRVIALMAQSAFGPLVIHFNPLTPDAVPVASTLDDWASSARQLLPH